MNILKKMVSILITLQLVFCIMSLTSTASTNENTIVSVERFDSPDSLIDVETSIETIQTALNSSGDGTHASFGNSPLPGAVSWSYGRFFFPANSNTGNITTSLKTALPLTNAHKSILEAKVKIKKAERDSDYMFKLFQNTTNSAETEGDPLLKISNGGSAYLLKSANNVSLTGTMDNNVWYHIYFVFATNESGVGTYDIYINGVKINTTPLPLVNNRTYNLTNISKIRFQRGGTAEETLYIDDIIAQKLVAPYVQGYAFGDDDFADANGTITDVPQHTGSINLDFNTIINSSTANNITLTKSDGTVVKSYAVRDSLDATRVKVMLLDSLDPRTTYTLSYAGVTDVINDASNNAADGTLVFTTGRATEKVVQDRFFWSAYASDNVEMLKAVAKQNSVVAVSSADSYTAIDDVKSKEEIPFITSTNAIAKNAADTWGEGLPKIRLESLGSGGIIYRIPQGAKDITVKAGVKSTTPTADIKCYVAKDLADFGTVLSKEITLTASEPAGSTWKRIQYRGTVVETGYTYVKVVMERVGTGPIYTPSPYAVDITPQVSGFVATLTQDTSVPGKLTATIDMSNHTAAPQTAVMVAACYKNDRLLRVALSDTISVAGGASDALTISGFNTEDSDRVKIMLWDDITLLHPLMK